MTTKKMPVKKKGIPTSGARLQAWLANPGLRSKLPTSALTPAQQAQRKLNARDPADVAATHAANEKFAPQEALNAGQLQVSDQQAANVGAWFKNYQDTINASTAAIQQAYQQGQQDVTNIGAGLSQAAGAQGAQTDAAMAADAANRGTTVAPSVGQVGQQAAGVRRDLAGSFAGMLTSQGVSAKAAGINQATIAAGQGTAAQLKELQNRRAIQGQGVQIAKDKANYKVDFKAQSADDARKRELEDRAFGLNSAKSINPDTGKPYSVESSAATRKAASKRWSETVNKYGVTNGAWAAWGKSEAGKAKRAAAIKSSKKSGGKSKEEKPQSGPGSLTKTQEDSKVTLVHTLRGLIDSAPAKDKNGKTLDIKANLIAGTYPHGSPNDPRVVALAMDLHANGGKLSSHGVELAHQLGIHVNGNFKIASKKTGKTLKKTGSAFHGF